MQGNDPLLNGCDTQDFEQEAFRPSEMSEKEKQLVSVFHRDYLVNFTAVQGKSSQCRVLVGT